MLNIHVGFCLIITSILAWFIRTNKYISSVFSLKQYLSPTRANNRMSWLQQFLYLQLHNAYLKSPRISAITLYLAYDRFPNCTIKKLSNSHSLLLLLFKSFFFSLENRSIFIFDFSTLLVLCVFFPCHIVCILVKSLFLLFCIVQYIRGAQMKSGKLT